jgi:hypothetical protein
MSSKKESNWPRDRWNRKPKKSVKSKEISDAMISEAAVKIARKTYGPRRQNPRPTTLWGDFAFTFTKGSKRMTFVPDWSKLTVWKKK